MLSFLVLAFLISTFLFLLGLVFPKIISKLLRVNNILSRKKILGIFGGIALLFFILIGALAPKAQPAKTDPQQTESKSQVASPVGTVGAPEATTEALVLASPSPVPSPIPTPIITPKPSSKPTPKPTVISKPTPKPSPTLNTTPAQSQTSVTIPTYGCDCGKTCTEISTCQEAQYQLNICGCSVRDNDHDGTACDGAPLHCQN